MEPLVLYMVIPEKNNLTKTYSKSCEQRLRQNFQKDFN